MVVPQSLAMDVETGPQKALCFGNGGGFTGKVQQYTLLPNGSLFIGAGLDGTSYTIEEAACKQIFSNYKLLRLSEMFINAPGNMYYFVEKQNAGHKQRLTWGAYDAGEPKELRIFHANLMKMAIAATKGAKGNKATK